MINFEENTEVFESAILNYLIKVDEDYELYDVENYRPKTRRVEGKPMFLY